MPGRYHLENIQSEFKINERILYLYEREHEKILGGKIGGVMKIKVGESFQPFKEEKI